MERERRRERIKIYVSMREMIVSKVVKKWFYKYHLFKKKNTNFKMLMSHIML